MFKKLCPFLCSDYKNRTKLLGHTLRITLKAERPHRISFVIRKI